MNGKVECRRATKQDYETAVKNEQARVEAEKQKREEEAAQAKREREEKIAREATEREAEAARKKAEWEEMRRKHDERLAKINQVKRGMTRDEVIAIMGDDYLMTDMGEETREGASDVAKKQMAQGYVFLAWRQFSGDREAGKSYWLVKFSPDDKVTSNYPNSDYHPDMSGNDGTVERTQVSEEQLRQRRERSQETPKTGE